MRPLNVVEIRVLACLAEKELATPDYYPLSLNALVNACNQKSNRDPVMQLDEEEIAEALEALRPLGLIMLSGEGGRVAKYAHNLGGKFNLTPEEQAVLTELMLRGPQTPGELRQRASRMVPFESLHAVEQVAGELLERDEPIIRRLPRQPGRKEQRLLQLLGGEPEINAEPPFESEAVNQACQRRERLDVLESQVIALRQELAALKTEFAQFKSQFD